VILCAGIAVLDFIFRVERFPTADAKVPMLEFLITGGGCAANAAIAIALLGGSARFSGPLGADAHGARVLEGLAHAGVDTAGAVRVAEAATCVSGIFLDRDGERLLTTRRDDALASTRPDAPERMLHGVDALLVDNHFPHFVVAICEAARVRDVPIVLDVDKPAASHDALFGLATHTIFSAEALRATTGLEDLAAGLARACEMCRGFVAVTDGGNGALWRAGDAAGHAPALAVEVADTLAAGDVFHGAFALALAEGRGDRDALAFASVAAGLKCTRFGGIVGTPQRAEVDRLLEKKPQY
jgi:sulfofructose kinase